LNNLTGSRSEDYDRMLNILLDIYRNSF